MCGGGGAGADLAAPVFAGAVCTPVKSLIGAGRDSVGGAGRGSRDHGGEGDICGIAYFIFLSSRGGAWLVIGREGRGR